MKAMILAAGLGTRLATLTDHLPKALVPVNGKPMLDLVLERLADAGFDRIIVNVHHFSELIIKHLESKSLPGITIEISDERDRLLDTGGAILKAHWFLEGSEPFLVHNTDVLSGIDLRLLMRYHLDSNSLATLAVSERKSSRYFLMDGELKLRGWENTVTGEKIPGAGLPENLHRMAFSGIHVIDPAIFQLFSEEDRFSIVVTYLRLCNSFPIRGYRHSTTGWYDLGNKEQLALAERYLRKK